jgi:hypothetical protein
MGERVPLIMVRRISENFCSSAHLMKQLTRGACILSLRMRECYCPTWPRLRRSDSSKSWVCSGQMISTYFKYLSLFIILSKLLSFSSLIFNVIFSRCEPGPSSSKIVSTYNGRRWCLFPPQKQFEIFSSLRCEAERNS